MELELRRVPSRDGCKERRCGAPGGSAAVWLSGSFTIALGDPVPAAGRKEGVHCIYLFFFLLY